MNKLFLVLLLILSGCSYNYHLHITASTIPPADTIQVEGMPNPRSAVEPREESPSPTKTGKPLSISPGDFQANQTQGGAMVNVLINLNLLKPTSVSTDANAQLQGIPGL